MQQPLFDISSITGLQSLWKETTGDARICIAVLDGSADLAHSCFSGCNIIPVDGDTPPALTPGKTLNHGTNVASIIFGRHGSEVTGIAPGCKGIVIPVYCEDAEGNVIPASQLDLARAMQQAAEMGASIINISGGEYSGSGASDTILADTIRNCVEQGIMVIAAAGNDGCDCLHIPASEEGVLAIGATDIAGHPLPFSNWGGAYKKNGILFPGEQINAAQAGGGTSRKSGTSFAAPIASGIAALLMSRALLHNQQTSSAQVSEALLLTAIQCNPVKGDACERFLAGKADIPAAIKYLGNLASNPVPAAGHMVMSAFGESDGAVAYPHSSIHRTHINTSDHLTKTNFNEMESFDQVSNELAYASEANAITGGIEPSCACENKEAGATATTTAPAAKQPPQLVYAIGTLGYEFKSEASKDSFLQFTGNLSDGTALLDFLDANPDASDDIHFTLNLDATPIYIIRPVSGFAAIAYANIRSILRAQLADGVTRVSLPGMVIGKGRLMMGQDVPVIAPWSYGIYSWSTQALVTAVAGEAPAADGKKKADFLVKARGIGNFLDRVYFELRNIGMLSRDRALNYAATNAFQIENVFAQAVNDQMELDSISVERSPVGKPGSDCWDVKLTFFNPTRRMEQARKIYRFTVDVSHVIPVTVGQVRSWSVY